MRVFRGLKEMILVDGDAEEWRRRAWSFGEGMKDLMWFLETLDMGVDIANYPRTLYQGSMEPKRHRPGQEQPSAEGRPQVGDDDEE